MHTRIKRRFVVVATAAIASLSFSGSILAACPPGTTAVAGQGCVAQGSAAAPTAAPARQLAPAPGSALSPAPTEQAGPLVPGAAIKPTSPLVLKCELDKGKAPYQYNVMATNISGARLPAGYQVQWQVKIVQLPPKKGTYLLAAPMPAGAPVAVGSLSSLAGVPTSCTAFASIP